MNKQVNLSENLEKLHEIASWFDQQTQVDVEEGLKKVKEAAALIKESKVRLKEIENEFAEIQADISQGDSIGSTVMDNIQVVVKETDGKDSSADNIPF